MTENHLGLIRVVRLLRQYAMDRERTPGIKLSLAIGRSLPTMLTDDESDSLHQVLTSLPGILKDYFVIEGKHKEAVKVIREGGCACNLFERYISDHEYSLNLQLSISSTFHNITRIKSDEFARIPLNLVNVGRKKKSRKNGTPERIQRMVKTEWVEENGYLKRRIPGPICEKDAISLLSFWSGISRHSVLKFCRNPNILLMTDFGK